MRQIRFAVLAFVSCIAAIASSFIDPGTFFNRTLSVALCSVLGLTSNLCYGNLARNAGDRAVAAIPPTEQTQNTFPTLDFSPYLQSTRPEFEGSDVPAKPENSNPSSNSSPSQPLLSAPSNAPSPKNPSPEPSRLTPADSTSNVPCNPTLQTTSAQPAKEVIVKGVPTSFTELVAGVKVNEINGFIPTMARRLENGDVAVTVPLHPTKGKAGGDVQLAISSSSGNDTCSVLSLQIEPLVRAPGSTKKLVASLQKYIDQSAKGAGITRDQLMTNSSNLPPGTASLALLQWILDNPNNPNSLKAISDGTAPLLKGQMFDIEVLDGLTANGGGSEAIERLIDGIPKQTQANSHLSNAYEVASSVGFTSNLGYLAPRASVSKNTADKPLRAAGTQVALVPVIDLFECGSSSVTTVTKLDSCMKQHRDYVKSKDSDAYKGFDAYCKAHFYIYMGAAVTALITTAATGGTASFATVPAAAVTAGIASVFAAMSFTMWAEVDAGISFLPSELKQLTFAVTKQSFPNPDDQAPGFVKDVILTATSKGYELTPAKIVQWVDALFGAVSTLAKLNRNLLESLVSLVNSNISDAIEKSSFNKVLKKSPPETYKVKAEPSVYPELIEATSIGVIAFSPNNDSYRPTGSSGEGKVNARTKPGSFGGAQPVDFSQVITVGKKDDDGGGGSTILDPHLRTFDGLKYDHHAVGEFVLTKSTDSAFEVQVREAAVPGKQVALNSAVAMKVGSNRVAFYVKDFPDSDTSNPLRVDGKPTVIQGGSLSLPGGGTITQVNQSGYLVLWSTGEQVAVEVQPFGGSDSGLLNILPNAPQTRQGQLIGLLGNFNGNQDDDLKSRDGKVLPPQSSINQVNQITQNISKFVPIPLNQVESVFLEQLHKQFGDSWRVSQAESLFDYSPGKNTENFTNRAFPNGFQVLRALLPAQVQAAEATCRQAGVASDRLEECIFDVGATGNADFAKAAANALTNIVRDRIQNEIQQRIPVPVKIPGFHL